MSAPSSLPSAVVLLIQPERDDRDMYAEFLRHAGMTLIILSEAAPALVVAPDWISRPAHEKSRVRERPRLLARRRAG